MKTTASILAVLALVIMATTSSLASDQTGTLTAEQYMRAEQTLLNGLQADNIGIKVWHHIDKTFFLNGTDAVHIPGYKFKSTIVIHFGSGSFAGTNPFLGTYSFQRTDITVRTDWSAY